MDWDPGSQIQKKLTQFEKHRIRDPDPQHCSLDPLFRNFYNRNAWEKKNIVQTGLRDWRVTIIASVLFLFLKIKIFLFTVYGVIVNVFKDIGGKQ